ncbi:MAG: T9SS type A sorting domain-containing protein [Bacteroidetes bacterium]|nr:T9SS type A sorting domain-containing protein [Bacteroidota bacterium]
MKFTLTTFLFSVITICFGQQTINGSIQHGGVQRSYILYVPASYSSTVAAPLVFNLHGYTGSAANIMFYGDLRPVADTAGFILVAPNGTVDASGYTYWNANWGGTVDDVDFINVLIDSLSATYNINQNRVYSTGFSNGGFMSYVLACELSNRIAAIASVAGSMTLGDPSTCSPLHPTPILEIHGNADGTVAYTGSNFSEPIVNVLNHWIGFNNCNTTPVFTAVPDINTSDNSTAEHYLYTGGNNCVEVEHYKILNGGHTWPSAPYNSGTTNRDINASRLIWQFFSKYDINGKIGGCTVTSIDDNNTNEFQINVYPNPAQDFLNINWEKSTVLPTTIRIINTLGEEVISTHLEKETILTSLNIQKLPRGIYIVEINDKAGMVIKNKIVLN